MIVGAGPAGLSAAYHLESDYVILEKEPEPGGLCRSFSLGGTTFDLGGHAFFTSHDYVRDLVEDRGVELFVQPRSAWIYSHETYLPYPFQCNLYGLPTEVVRECLVGLCEAAADRSEVPVPTLQQWIDRTFGSGISRHFMTPYNAKTWAFPPTEILADWTPRRIVTPDFDAIIRGALERTDFTAFPNAMVAYPATGGYFGLYEGLVDAVGPRLRHDGIASINLGHRYVSTDSGERVEYDCPSRRCRSRSSSRSPRTPRTAAEKRRRRSRTTLCISSTSCSAGQP